MFIRVKNITKFIDSNLNYLSQAIEDHSNIGEKEYSEYLLKMSHTLNNQISKLNSISSNQKLIDKYTNKVEELLTKSNIRAK